MAGFIEDRLAEWNAANNTFRESLRREMLNNHFMAAVESTAPDTPGVQKLRGDRLMRLMNLVWSTDLHKFKMHLVVMDLHAKVFNDEDLVTFLYGLSARMKCQLTHAGYHGIVVEFLESLGDFTVPSDVRGKMADRIASESLNEVLADPINSPNRMFAVNDWLAMCAWIKFNMDVLLEVAREISPAPAK